MIDWVGLNQAVGIGNGGGGAIGTVANVLLNKRGQDMQYELGKEQLAQQARGMSLDDAYRNRVVTDGRERFDAELAAKQKEAQDLLQLDREKLKVEDKYKTALGAQAYGAANRNNAEAETIRGRERRLQHQYDTKLMAEAARKIHARMQAGINRIMRQDGLDYNSAAQKYGETEEGLNYLNIIANTRGFRKANDGRPHVAREPLHAFEPDGQGNLIPLIEAKDGRFAPMTPGGTQTKERTPDQGTRIPGGETVLGMMQYLSVVGDTRNLDDMADIVAAKELVDRVGVGMGRYQGSATPATDEPPAKAAWDDAVRNDPKVARELADRDEQSAVARNKAFYVQQVPTLSALERDALEGKAISPEGRLDAKSDRELKKIAAEKTLDPMQQWELKDKMRKYGEEQMAQWTAAAVEAGLFDDSGTWKRLAATLFGKSAGAEHLTPQNFMNRFVTVALLNGDKIGIPSDPQYWRPEHFRKAYDYMYRVGVEGQDNRNLLLPDWELLGNRDSFKKELKRATLGDAAMTP